MTRLLISTCQRVNWWRGIETREGIHGCQDAEECVSCVWGKRAKNESDWIF